MQTSIKYFGYKISGIGLLEVMIGATLLSLIVLGSAGLQSKATQMILDSSNKQVAINMSNQMVSMIASLRTKDIVTIGSGNCDIFDPTGCSRLDFSKNLLNYWNSNNLLPQGTVCVYYGGYDQNTNILTVNIRTTWVSLAGANKTLTKTILFFPIDLISGGSVNWKSSC